MAPIKPFNVQYLKSKIRTNKSVCIDVVNNYISRRINRLDTAEKIIKGLQSRGEVTKQKAYEQLAGAEAQLQTRQVSNIMSDIKVIFNNTPLIKNDEMETRNFKEVIKHQKERLLKELQKELKIKQHMKIKMVLNLKVMYMEEDPEDELKSIRVEKEIPLGTSFNTANANNLSLLLNNDINNIDAQVEGLGTQTRIAGINGSYWRIMYYIDLVVTIVQINPVRAASYIPTPVKYNHPKSGLINIQNDDNKCFQWCMKYHQSKKNKHDNRVSVLTKVLDNFNYVGIEYPVSFDDISKFEDLNKISIFVYEINADDITLARSGNLNYIQGDNMIYLLKLEDNDIAHYVYIKNICHFLHASKNIRTGDNKYCPVCDETIPMNEFNGHINNCIKCRLNTTDSDISMLKLPQKGSVMKFKNHKHKIRRDYIAYADCESTLKLIKSVFSGSSSETEGGTKKSKTEKISEHIVNSCSFYLVCHSDPRQNKYYEFKGPESLRDMLLKLDEIATKIYGSSDEVTFF